MNPIETFAKACDLTQRQVDAAVAAPDAQSGCAEWSATQLVNHMVFGLGMWADIFAEARAGGLNAIETYCFWTDHEQVCTVRDSILGWPPATACCLLHGVADLGSIPGPHRCGAAASTGLAARTLAGSSGRRGRPASGCCCGRARTSARSTAAAVCCPGLQPRPPAR